MSKFKIGDRIEVVKLMDESLEAKIGDVGVIIRIDEEDEFPIRTNINKEKDYGFKEDEIDFENRVKLKNMEIVFQELFDLLADNKCNEKIFNKFYELSNTYKEEKNMIKKMHRDIVSFLR